MPREWVVRISDMLEAMHRIERYTRGMDRDRFAANDLVLDAVLRNLEVIGEAARHIPPDVAENRPEVPWGRLRGMRNVVIHEYFGVDSSIIWATISDDLPGLVPLLEKIIAEG